MFSLQKNYGNLSNQVLQQNSVNVYLHKFKYDTRKSLWPEGKTWNDSALVKLQRPIEDMVKITNGIIEEDSDAFRAFAFDAHPQAYIDAGLFTLSIQDLVKIGTTPSFDHLFSEEGAQQIVTIIYKWLEN